MSEELELNTDTQDFVLEQEPVVNEMQEIDLLEELSNHDFSSDEPTDIDKYFAVLEDAERDNELFKSQESENIITELSPKYMDEDYLKDLNKSKENLLSFIKKHDVNGDIIQKMSEQDKDKVFAIGKFLNRCFVSKVNELTFTFELTIEEYKFISTAFRSKMSYDGTEVFNLIELKQRYLDEWEQKYKALPKGVPGFFVTIDIKNVVMLYHFLSKHTVKGVEKEFYYFVEVLTKIADTNRLFNAYNVVKDRLNSEFFVWSGSITPNDKKVGEIAKEETKKD